jgi:hypothetical protein
MNDPTPHEKTRIRQLEDAAAHWEHKYSNARQYNRNLEDRIRALEAALRSIAANTCCGPCQEAARVAASALETASKPDRCEHGVWLADHCYRCNPGACTHEWVDVVDVCTDRPCNGNILGWKCARCGQFDGTRSTSVKTKHMEGCRCPECDPDYNDPREQL